MSMAIGSYRDLSYNICIARERDALVIEIDNIPQLSHKGNEQ